MLLAAFPKDRQEEEYSSDDQCKMRQAFTQQWVRLGLREKAG